MSFSFLKMHGLGNDFVIIDQRVEALDVAGHAAYLADRRRGIGCDQVIVLNTPKKGEESEGVDIAVSFYNHDGSPAAACGNGTRCIADLIMAEQNLSRVRIQTDSGLLTAQRTQDGQIEVDMGRPTFGAAVMGWTGAHEGDQAIITSQGALHDEDTDFARAWMVSMGNPHLVFFGNQRDDFPAFGARIGALAELTDGANIGLATILDPGQLRLRVYERGAGITLACGTGACAAAAMAMTHYHAARTVRVHVDGGELVIRWPSTQATMTMTGPVFYVYRGQWHGTSHSINHLNPKKT
ncbi:MAG: diaminopimelate epimerase [Pseudomonadota bacterium]